jgi:hypothetical protein
LAVFVVLPAAAQEAAPSARATLDWRAESLRSCLDAASLESRIERHLGRKVFFPEGKADFGLRVVADQTHGIWQVRVELLSGETVLGTRNLEAPTSECGRLSETLVLVGAMLVDVPRDATKAQAGEAGAVPARPRSRPVKHAALPREQRSSEQRIWQADAGAVAEVGSGLVPAPAWGLALVGTLGPSGSLSAQVGFDMWWGDSVTKGRGSASFAALSMRAGIGAALLSFGSLGRLRAFAFVEGGVIRARAEGFDVNRSDTRGFVALGLAIRPEVELGASLFLLAEGGARVLPSRPEFVHEAPAAAATALHRADPVALSGGIGLGWKIP